ncbi:hypothetical protein D3C78_1166970 [compost metagenome]
MIVKISRQQLNHDRLSWLCIEPSLLSVRGKDIVSKAEVYDRLNEGQKALYMFYAFHNHTNSAAEFYWFAAYFMSDLQGWPALKKGITFFGEHHVLDALNEIELVLERYNRLEDGAWKAASPSDLDCHIDLLAEVNAIYDKYAVVAAQAIDRMNDYVREHLDDFFIVID